MCGCGCGCGCECECECRTCAPEVVWERKAAVNDEDMLLFKLLGRFATPAPVAAREEDKLERRTEHVKAKSNAETNANKTASHE